jgi:hypothetical protein
MHALTRRLRPILVGKVRLIWISLLILLLAVATACGVRGAGEIVLVTTEASFGTIPNDSPVTQVFEIRNDGTGTLRITQLSTSCSCTIVEVESDRIAPGESTLLTVTFDPTTHNGATGDFMHQVFIRSNDPDTPEARFTLWVTVVEA